MKNGNLVAIGGIYVDVNAPQFPISETGLKPETEIVGKDYILELGGSAVNFARMCAAMEIPTTFVGKVGSDYMGQLLAKLLPEARVEPSLIESDEVQTNISFNMVSNEGKSIMAVVGSANQALEADEVYERVLDQLNDSPYLFLGGCFKLKNLLPAYAKLVDDAKQTGTKVVIDHGRLNDGVTEDEKVIVRDITKEADIYLPSADEFMQLWEVESLEEGLRNFREQSNAIIVLKDGANGAITITSAGHIIRVPSFPVEAIHTVGAGDSFDAGFISAQYKGYDLEESIRFGCATGALKVSSTELPTFQSVSALVG